MRACVCVHARISLLTRRVLFPSLNAVRQDSGPIHCFLPQPRGSGPMVTIVSQAVTPQWSLQAQTPSTLLAEKGLTRRKTIYFSTHSGTGRFFFSFKRAIAGVPLKLGRLPSQQPILRGGAGELPGQRASGWPERSAAHCPLPRSEKLTLCGLLSIFNAWA